MKKIMYLKIQLIFQLILVVNFGIAQNNNGLIKHDPKFLFGYVIIDNADYPAVSRWEIEVVERVFEDSLNYTDIKVFSETLIKSNYTRLPIDYLNDEYGYYRLFVYGINKKGNVVVTDEWDLTLPEPIGSNTYVKECDWDCNSYNYAWKISGYKKYINGIPTHTGRLSIDPLYNAINLGVGGIPYYVYITPDDFESLTNTTLKWQAFWRNHCLYHCSYLTAPDNIMDCNSVYQIIQLHNVDISHGLKGYYGQTVSGPIVYGVQKTRGPWEGHVSFGDDIGGIHCNWSIQHAIATMNANCYDIVNENYPALECAGTGSIFPVPGTLAEIEHSKFLECLISTNWNQDFYLAYNELRSCVLGTPRPLHGLDTLFSQVAIKCISTSSGGSGYDLINIDLQNMFDNQGNVITPRFVYEPGLYFWGFELQNRAYIYYVTEITDQTISCLRIADFIEASIRPVPLIDNNFTLDINSPIQTDAIFELYDYNGNLVHAEILNVLSGANSFSIYSRSSIPRGLLVNVLKFVDNSVYTINTQKR